MRTAAKAVVLTAVAALTLSPGALAASPIQMDPTPRSLELVANVPFQAPAWSTVELGTFEVQEEQRDFAFVLDRRGTLKSIDVTDRANPVVASEVCARIPSGADAVIDVRPDLGLLVSVGGTCLGGGSGIGVFDVSNPLSIRPLASYNPGATHTVSLHPTQPYAYVGSAGLMPTFGGRVPIVDLSNPSKPKLAASFMTGSNFPHDVQFNSEGTRAFAAMPDRTEVWDVTSGAAPRLVQTIHDPTATPHAWARPSPDGTSLVLVGTTGAEPTCPGGALHFYSLNTVGVPVETGVYAVPPAASGGRCGPFFHDVHPDPSTNLMTSAWGRNGTRVLSLVTTVTPGCREVAASDPSLGSDAQHSTFFKGHIYTTDANRGLDVFELPRQQIGWCP